MSGSGQRQESGTPFRSPVGGRNPSTWVLIYCFLGEFMGVWMGSRMAETRTRTPVWDVGILSSGLVHCAMVPTSISK